MKKALVTILITSATIISNAQNLVNTLKTGDKYKVESKSEAKINLESPMGSIDINNTSTSYNNLEIKAVKDSLIEAANTITRIVLNSSAMGRETNFDSDKDKSSDNPMMQGVADNIGKEIAIKSDGKGNLIKEKVVVEEDDENPMKMFSKFMDVIPTRDWMDILTPAAVGKEIKQGSVWQYEYVKSGDIVNTFTTTYTVASVENDIATINFEGTITSKGEMSMMGQNGKLTGTHKEKGSLKLNSKTGIVIESNSNITIDAVIKASGEKLPVKGSLVKTVKVN